MLSDGPPSFDEVTTSLTWRELVEVLSPDEPHHERSCDPRHDPRRDQDQRPTARQREGALGPGLHGVVSARPQPPVSERHVRGFVSQQQIEHGAAGEDHPQRIAGPVAAGMLRIPSRLDRVPDAVVEQPKREENERCRTPAFFGGEPDDARQILDLARDPNRDAHGEQPDHHIHLAFAREADARDKTAGARWAETKDAAE